MNNALDIYAAQMVELRAEIERMRAELAVKDKAITDMIAACSDTGKLRAECDELQWKLNTYSDQSEGRIEALIERAKKAEAEVERLRGLKLKGGRDE